MGLLSNTETWDEDTYGNNIKTLRVLVECEKGSTNKYEYDDTLDRMVIVRTLNKKYKYIYNYGSIPQTLAGDGDWLDAILVSTEPIRSGTLVNAKPIATIKMIDNKEEDDKVICVPFYEEHGTISIKDIIKYLRSYKYPYNEGTEILTILGEKETLDIITNSQINFTGGNKKDEICIR